MNTFNDASRFAWACGVFGLQPGATQQAIRAAILAHLDEANFVPPAAWRQAIWLLSDPKAPQAWPENGYDAFHEALENSLAEDVDAFATQFFSLPRGPRRAKWTQLLEQLTAFPRLRARLTLLQPGLDVEAATSADQNPQDAIVVDRIRRLFVLKPADQDAQRRQWLATMTGDWKPVVRRVRAKYPKLAQLDADFLAALASAGRDAAVMNSSVALAANTNLAASFVTVATASAAAPSRARSKAGSSSGSSKGFSPWMLVWIVFVLGRVVASLNSTQSTYNFTPPPNPSNSRHVYAPPSPSPATSPSVAEEIQRILAEQRSQASKSGSNPAPRTPDGPSPRTSLPPYGVRGEADDGTQAENRLPVWPPPPPSATGRDSSGAVFPEGSGP